MGGHLDATGNYVASWSLANPAAQLYAAVLPSARSVQTGTPATAFGTIINSGPATATACGLAAPAGFPAIFSYQTTAPNNVPSGQANTAVDIASGGVQNFVFAITPLQNLNATDVPLTFACSNTPAVATVSGLNTFLLSSSSTPSPDLISVGSTPTGDGILNIPGNAASTAFAAAAINIGSPGSIVAGIDDNGAGLSLQLALCQSNPATAACVNPTTPASNAIISVNPNDVLTYTIFATATGNVPFDPGNNRLFLRFKTPDGVTRGATSVCPSSGNLRLIRRFEKRGSGSSGVKFKLPAADAASDGLRWLQV